MDYPHNLLRLNIFVAGRFSRSDNVREREADLTFQVDPSLEHERKTSTNLFSFPSLNEGASIQNVAGSTESFLYFGFQPSAIFY